MCLSCVPRVTFSRSLKFSYFIFMLQPIFFDRCGLLQDQVFSWLSHEFIYHIWGLLLKLITLPAESTRMQKIHIRPFSTFSLNCLLISKISINILFSSYILVIGLGSKFLSYLRLLHFALSDFALKMFHFGSKIELVIFRVKTLLHFGSKVVTFSVNITLCVKRCYMLRQLLYFAALR